MLPAGFSSLEAPGSAQTKLFLTSQLNLHQHLYCVPHNLDIWFSFSSSFIACHHLQNHTESTYLFLALGSAPQL